MGVLDKLKSIGASIAETADDAVETGKVKSKIKDENKAIQEAFAQIGETVYTKIKNGELAQIAEVDEKITAIDDHLAQIEELQKKIVEIKETQKYGVKKD